MLKIVWKALKHKRSYFKIGTGRAQPSFDAIQVEYYGAATHRQLANVVQKMRVL